MRNIREFLAFLFHFSISSVLVQDKEFYKILIITSLMQNNALQKVA